MSIQTAAYLSLIKNQFSDPLYMNSLYILVTRAIIVTAGFLFWMIAARLYSIEDVGLAVALISSGGLVNLVATLGFEHSVIRFISTYDVRKIVNSSVAIITVTSVVTGVGYCVITLLLPHKAMMLDQQFAPVMFVIYCIVSSIAILLGNTFLAMRKPLEYMAQNLINSSRVLILLPMVFLGSIGIFGSALIANVITLSIMFYFLGRSVKLDLKIDREYVANSFRYSAGNFVANLFYNMPGMLLPIIVLAVLGEASVAVAYIALTIGNFLMEMTVTLSTALFIEGSHGKSLRKNVLKCTAATYSLLVPGFLVFYFFGSYFLALYGGVYAEGIDLLRLMAFASFFHAIYYIFCTIQKVMMGVGSLMKLNGLLFVLSISLSCVFMLLLGVTGIGYAVILTYLIMDLIVLANARKEKWI